MDLIDLGLKHKISREGPLAARMRPRNLDEVVGQEQILARGKPLRVIVERGHLISLLLQGPPGSGKTSLAGVITAGSKAAVTSLNAVSVGVKEVRVIIETARENWSLNGQRTILFIDEIHRFNRAQQDVLLGAVEEGILIFIGATTENPFFYLTGPLLSRTRLFVLEPLDENSIIGLLQKALEDRERGLGELPHQVEPEALRCLARLAGGDARVALNALEAAVLVAGPPGKPALITAEAAAGALQVKMAAYDRQGDNHYDMASALIKSIRGSDPDAALYWIARMLKGGEDPLFIARRLVISAAEDIGNADPRALEIATAATEAVRLIGLPEGRIPLAQAAVYLAASPKSNAVYLAINGAMQAAEDTTQEPVPAHLRDRSYRGAERLGHGLGYRYPHDYPNHYVQQEYLPRGLAGKRFYHPSSQGYEDVLRLYLENLQSSGDKPGKRLTDD